MSKYKVSLVLIVYNTEEWIEECLESIYQQPLKELEIVIVNSNSNDETNAILEHKIEGHENIVYIHCEENVGGATAGNIGIKNASGDYVFMMDSDDVLPLNALESLYKEAERTQADVIIGRGKSIINGKTYNNKYKPDLITWAKAQTVNDLREAPYLAMAPFYWGKLYRRSMLLEHEIFMIDGMINADRYFNTKALKYAKGIAVITDECYYWRRHSLSEKKQSITQQRTNISGFIDRIKSTKLTEDLFEEPGYEDTHDFICRAGLLRLLIMVNDIKEKNDFSEVYLNEMSAYLADIKDSIIFESEKFTSRQKVLLYYMKYKRYDELYEFISTKPESKTETVDDMIVYQYTDLPNLPKEACTELRTAADSCIGRVKKPLFGNTRIYITLPTWKKAKLSIEAVYLMYEDKTECHSLKITKLRKKDHALRCYISLSKEQASYIEDKHIYYLSLVYTINSIKTNRMRVTDSNDDLLCIRRKSNQINVSAIPKEYTLDKKGRIVKQK